MGQNLKGKELGKGIYQRKDGTYCGRYTDRFGKRKTIYRKKLGELRLALNEATYEDKILEKSVYSEINLDDWFGQWMNLFKRNLKPNSRSTYWTLYKKHISPILGNQKISSITKLQIMALLNDLEDKGYADGTVSLIKDICFNLFENAVASDFLYKNPVKGVKLDKRKNPYGIKALSVQEQSAFFEVCKTSFYNNAFITHVNTGLRPGELFALMDEDVDFEHNVIKISKTLDYKSINGGKTSFHIFTPKTNASNRIVPMNDLCRAAIELQLRQREVFQVRSKDFPGLIFTTSKGDPICTSSYNGAIATIINRINANKETFGIKTSIKKLTGHCLRHTFATRCFEAGIPPKVIQQYLGHATLSMTMDIYTHVTNEYKESEIAKLEDLNVNLMPHYVGQKNDQFVNWSKIGAKQFSAKTRPLQASNFQAFQRTQIKSILNQFLNSHPI